MPRYRVVFDAYASLDVEADSPEEAADNAMFDVKLEDLQLEVDSVELLQDDDP